mmetsp:Transcript_36781/g.68453  ORF Transcript_36781/g.68453 Transcript_36781/m.68453 type:complete len:362 (+) Transcript_36781:78-1163(+)
MIGRAPRKSGYDTVSTGSAGCVEDLLSEADGSNGQLVYVGNGRGSFAKMDHVQFVGQGRGDFNMVQEVGCCRRYFWCWVCILCGLIALVLATMIWTVELKTAQSPAADETRYSCYNMAGDLPPPNAQMIQTWSIPHKIWCCDNVGVGCETSSTTSVQTTWIRIPVPKFDPGFLAPHSAGGPPVVPFAMQFHCHTGIPSGWSPEQRQFCCETTQIGCEQPVAAEPDCVVKAGNDVAVWPVTKRAWCCEHHNVACVQESAADGNDCNAGDPSTWAEAKMTFCCTALGLGCTTALPQQSEVYDCTEGYANWKSWPSGKQAWCCQHHGRACDLEQTPLYDCTNEKVPWTTEQKEWCCTHHGKGCA